MVPKVSVVIALNKTFLLLGQLVFDFFILVHIHRLKRRKMKWKMGKKNLVYIISIKVHLYSWKSFLVPAQRRSFRPFGLLAFSLFFLHRQNNHQQAKRVKQKAHHPLYLQEVYLLSKLAYITSVSSVLLEIWLK